MTFATRLLGTTSPPQTATLTNTGTQTVTISQIAATPPFSRSNGCPSSLQVGANCQIQVFFTPTDPNGVNGTLSVTDNAQGSPQMVSLTGTGLEVRFSPIGVNFGNQQVRTQSQPVPITLTNLGKNALNISQITINGADAQDFLPNNTNNCGNSVPGGGTCTINVTFTPTQKGSRSANVAVYDDGGPSPQLVPLAGTGT